MGKEELRSKMKEIENIPAKDIPLLTFEEIFVACAEEMKSMKLEDFALLDTWMKAYEMYLDLHPTTSESVTKHYYTYLKSSVMYQIYQKEQKRKQKVHDLYALELEYVQFLQKQRGMNFDHQEREYIHLLLKLEQLLDTVDEHTVYIVHNILIYYKVLAERFTLIYGSHHLDRSLLKTRYCMINEDQNYQKLKTERH